MGAEDSGALNEKLNSIVNKEKNIVRSNSPQQIEPDWGSLILSSKNECPSEKERSKLKTKTK